ncbi:unnamed protein product [Sphagnum balticum]
MDYGHTKYLDSLMGQKAAVMKALERLEKRTSEVLYKQQKWFKWVREVQDEEEAKKEKEQKKVKQEAAMFRRNWKAAQLRMRDWRAKEDKKRNDAYLEQVYKERMAQKEKDGDGRMMGTRWIGIRLRMFWRIVGEVTLVCWRDPISAFTY